MTEMKAIKLCLKYRDPTGFDFLVKLFRKEAYFHALGFLGNSDDAADACQEAFLKAFRVMPLLEKLDNFYPWFYCILKNHCLNLISRQKTVQANENAISREQQLRSGFNSDVLLEHEDDKKMIWKVLGMLDPEFREILVLKYFSEMDYERISKQLGIVRGTVMSRLYHARKAFKNQYLRLKSTQEG